MILAIIGRIGTGGGIGSVIEYRGDTIAGALDGGPHDDLQHVDRGRRQGRAHRARRRHLRLPRGPDPRAEGRGVGGRPRRLAHRCPPTTAPPSTRRCTSTPPTSRRTCRGAPTRPRSCRWPAPSRRPTTSPTPNERDERRPGPRVHGPHRRHAGARRRRRHRVHRQLHQLAHRGPAGRRRGGRGSPGEGRRPHARRARLVRGEAPGRGRGARPGVHRRRLRLAGAGLLDVPGHEPRQAGPRRAGGLHQQPQLRGPAGPRRAHPPRLPRRRRRHRHRRPLRPPADWIVR